MSQTIQEKNKALVLEAQNQSAFTEIRTRIDHD